MAVACSSPHMQPTLRPNPDSLPMVQSLRLRNTASGTLGNAPRNFLHDQNLWNLDASVFRIFPIAEGFKLKLDLEAFNALNHPVLNDPGATVTTASSFGKITGFQSGNANRILQGSGRFQF
jgi:hypothetical protein